MQPSDTGLMIESDFFFDGQKSEPSTNRFRYPLPRGTFFYRSDILIPRVWPEDDIAELLSAYQQFKVAAVGDDSVDWSAVSASFGGRYSPMECLMMFRNKADPEINQQPWSVQEAETLADLVHNKGYHWIEAAAALGTHRTPLQCLQYYQVLIFTQIPILIFTMIFVQFVLFTTLSTLFLSWPLYI